MDDVFAAWPSANPLIERAIAASDGSRADYLNKLRDIVRESLDSGSAVGFDVLAQALREMSAGTSQTPAEDLLRESRDER